MSLEDVLPLKYVEDLVEEASDPGKRANAIRALVLKKEALDLAADLRANGRRG